MLLDDAARQGHVLRHVEHRPWPLPDRGWTLAQTWEDVLFAHWRVPEQAVAALVPDGFQVEAHDGDAWLGIVALRLTSARARGTLPVPGLSTALALHVRTYVRAGGRPGIWLLGLDVSTRLAAEAARLVWGLRCFHSRLSSARRGEWIDVECARPAEAGRVFSASYRPRGGVAYARPGSLEWFLAERYCAYAVDRAGRLRRAELHHGLWPLEPAEAEIGLSSIAPLPLAGDPVCHVAARSDVLAWSLEPVG